MASFCSRRVHLSLDLRREFPARAAQRRLSSSAAEVLAEIVV